MIIPLGSGSLRNSSSLPEGRSNATFRMRRIRAGPALPSYLALLHAGFAMPRMLPFERWALTPPFHPCQIRRTITGLLSVLPRAGPRGPRVPAVSVSVALSVAASPSPAFANVDAQPPGVTRRVAPPSHALSSPQRPESGLSSRPLPSREANRRSPGSPATHKYSRHPHPGLSRISPSFIVGSTLSRGQELGITARPTEVKRRARIGSNLH